MLSAYQSDRARRNLEGYALLGGDCGCGCKGSGRCNPTLRGLGASSPLTPAEAMQQAVSMYSGQNLNPKQFQNAAWMSAAQAIIEAGQFPATSAEGIAADCSGISAQPLKLFSTVSGLSLSAAATTTGIATATGVITAATSMALGAATMGAGLVIAVIGTIFAHHAAAVKRDQEFGCSALPAVNNAFAVIAQAVQDGQTTPAAAAAALPEIYSQFMKAGGAGGSISGPSGIPGGGQPINNHPWCNANCELSVVLLGMVLYWKSQYEAMAARQASAPATSSASSSSASGSSPNWLMIAALVAGGFVLARAV